MSIIERDEVTPQVISQTVFANVANNVSGALAVAAASTDTTLTLSPGGGALFPNAPFYCSCEFEVMWCLSKSGDTLIVQRAQDGTLASAHPIGQVIEMRNNAGLWKDHSTAINRLESGVSDGTALPANTAYTDATQELTHKTIDLTDPTKGNQIIGTVSPDPSQLAYSNILTNGGFDTWYFPNSTNIAAGSSVSGSKQSPFTNYWDCWAVNDSSITVSKDTTNPDPFAPSGNNILVNVNTVQANGYVEIGQTLDNTRTLNFNNIVGAAISVSSRIKQLTGGVQVAFRFLYTDSAGLQHSDLGPWLTLTTGQYVTLKREGIIWIPSLDATSGRLTIAFKGVGQIALDNVMLINSPLAANFRPVFPIPQSPQPNLLQNGGFEQWHFGTGPISANAQMVSDQWMLYLGASSQHSSQRIASTIGNTGYSTQITYTHAAGGSLDYVQTFPDFNVSQLLGRQVTFSIRIKSNSVGTVRAGIQDGIGWKYGAANISTIAETLYFTTVINSAATMLQVGINCNVANCVVELNDATLVLGPVPAIFIPPIALPDVIPTERLATDVARANILTNGGFEIWQRGSGPFGADGVIGPDKWRIDSGGVAYAVSRQTNNPDPVYGGTSTAYVTVSGAGTISLRQDIENFADYKGRTITLSVRVNANPIGSVRCWVFDGGSSSYSQYNIGTPWERLSVTHKVYSSASTLRVYISCTGPSFVGHIDSVMLSVGSGVVDYIPPNVADEMARCFRYYEAFGGSAGAHLVTGQVAGATYAYAAFPYKVRKATTPTITFGGIINVTQATGTQVAGTPSAAAINGDVFQLGMGGGSGLVAGNASMIITGNGGMVMAEANP